MSEIPLHLRPGAPQRRVVCAANRNDATGDLAIGPRHFDATMRAGIDACVAGAPYPNQARAEWRKASQGFIDQWGTFMDRCEAFAVAKAAGQILYGPHLGHCEPPELDSSDLY